MTNLLDLSRNTLLLARAKGLRIATAESCTGGLVSASLTEIPGSSDVFDRAFISYSNFAKTEMIEVTPATLDEFGAVSYQVAAQMARGAIKNSDADIAVSITGIAGPGSNTEKPEGRVCFGVSDKSGMTRTETVEFGALGRSKVRREATIYALKLLQDTLKDL